MFEHDRTHSNFSSNGVWMSFNKSLAMLPHCKLFLAIPLYCNFGSCASMYNALDPLDFRYIPYIWFFPCILRGVLPYPLLFCSLQYIYQDLYCSYFSACRWNLQRQLEILSPISSWSCKHIGLTIWFQHSPASFCTRWIINIEYVLHHHYGTMVMVELVSNMHHPLVLTIHLS